MKPYTAKNRILESSLGIIRSNPVHYFTDDEWNDIEYAVSQAVDKAFDAGMREQRKKQAVHKFIGMKGIIKCL